MATLKRDEAINVLTNEIRDNVGGDDLVETYNELFPETPVPSDPGSLKTEITNYIQKGLEVEELLDLWNVVFPKDRNVWHDDESDSIHRNEPAETIGYAE